MNTMITRNILLRTLSTWLRIEADQVPVGPLEGLVADAPFIPKRAEWVRRLVFSVLRRVSQQQQIRITDALKGLRRTGGAPQSLLGFSATLEAMRQLKEEVAAAGLPVCNAKGGVCFSHDIDWLECQQTAPRLAALEAESGANASYMFLTEWNYRLDHGLVQELAAAGFEIGLHGTEHDIALAYRSPQRIGRILERGLAAIPVTVQGYRSPALSSSPALFKVLAEMGFAYDSSLAVGSAHTLGVGLCLPLVLDSGLVEIPLTLQDSMLFRDWHMTDADALTVTVELMRQIVDLGGLFVFNGHPGILRNHLDFFKGLLAEAHQYKVLTMGQAVVDWQVRQGLALA